VSRINQKKQLTLIIASGVVGVGLLTFASLGFWDFFQTTRTGIDIPTSATVTQTTTVSEKPVVVNQTSYSVPADQARTIQIPKLGIDAYVQKVGMDKSGAMSTSNNINFAGWYVKSVTPGSDGVSIINGHAGGRYTEGIFRHIGTLEPADIISIQMGDMSVRTFSVVSTVTYDVADAAEPLLHDDPSIDEELHLITCDGTFDDHLQSYDKRTIIVAKYIR